MQMTLLHGYPDYIGKRFAFVGYGSGPLAVPAFALGDPVVFPRFGNYIDILFGGKSPDGLFSAEGFPSAVGARASWALTWKFQSTGSVGSVTQSAAGVGMTPGTYTTPATGGGGTGASITFTVLTATTIGPISVTPGKNYTSAPTFTAATGGTPPTFNVTLSAPGMLVPAGSNVSGSQIQVAGFGGVY